MTSGNIIKRHEDLFQGVDIPVPDSLFEDRKHRSLATRDFGSSVTPRSRIRSLYCDFCRDDYVTGKLEGTEGMNFEEKGIAAYQKYLKDYLRTVAAIDESVGQLINTLEEDGSLENQLSFIRLIREYFWENMIIRISVGVLKKVCAPRF